MHSSSSCFFFNHPENLNSLCKLSLRTVTLNIKIVSAFMVSVKEDRNGKLQVFIGNLYSIENHPLVFTYKQPKKKAMTNNPYVHQTRPSNNSQLFYFPCHRLFIDLSETVLASNS